MEMISRNKVVVTEMTRGEYNTLRGWTVPEDENPNDSGFLIEHVGTQPNTKDFAGYIEWKPSDFVYERYVRVDNPLERLVVEKEDLHDRINKLSDFIQYAQETFHRLPEEQKLLMVNQLPLMKSLEEILAKRIELMQNDDS